MKRSSVGTSAEPWTPIATPTVHRSPTLASPPPPSRFATRAARPRPGPASRRTARATLRGTAESTGPARASNLAAHDEPTATRHVSRVGLAYLAAWSAVVASACAGSQVSPGTGREAAVGDTCSTASSAEVSDAAVQSLERASNLLEYEAAWRNAHPGSTTGSIAGTDARARIRARVADVQSCYEAALDSLPAGGGRILVRFIIDSSGRVATASIVSKNIDAPSVGCCVVKRVSEWTFPPVTEGFVAIEYPFTVRVSK